MKINHQIRICAFLTILCFIGSGMLQGICRAKSHAEIVTEGDDEFEVS